MAKTTFELDKGTGDVIINFKRDRTMKFIKLLGILIIMFFTSGCFLTKAVTVPMRVGAAVISAIPGVGNAADTAIDAVADAVDKIPL